MEVIAFLSLRTEFRVLIAAVVLLTAGNATTLAQQHAHKVLVLYS